MDRRGFLQTGASALAAGAFTPRSLAQSETASPSAKAATGPAKKLKVDAYSRHLQWLRTPDEVAEATIEMGFDGVDVTVRPYPGHVDPEKVATDLPAFVNAIRKHGLQVVTITCPITDADSPNAEKILQTASSLGINHYWWGTFRYDPTQSVMAQLDALKPRVEKLARLNEKYKMKAMYHTYSIPGTVGENVWDFLYVLKNFDPQYVGLHWDVGHTSLTGGNGTWANSLRAAGPYIAGVSAKDYLYELNLDVPEGGPFMGTPESLNTRSFGWSRPPAAPAAGAAPLPRSQAAEQAASERGMSAEAPKPTGPLAAAKPGQPDQASLAGSGSRPAQSGAGGGRGRNATPPGRGGGGQPNPWRSKAVPLGEGLADLPLLASILREINFDGPIEIQAEYPNGGANDAHDKITLPRIMVLGAMKRDLLTLKAAFAASGLL
jgi:sugar phosphate isomerase/epimerase